DDEGKAELRLVGVVQAMEARILLVRQGIESGARLLAAGGVGDVAGARGLAGEVGMLAQKGKLRLARRSPDDTHHRRVQVGYRLVRTPGRRGLGDPRGALEGFADRLHEVGG